MKKNLSASRSILVVAVLGVVCLFNLFPSCNVSTAGISDVKVCTTKGSGGDCGSDAASFPGSTTVLFCSAVVKNAPSDTKVTFEWKHGSESMGKADVVTSSGVVSSNWNTNGAVEPGSYSVTVKLNTDNSTPITKEFTIE